MESTTAADMEATTIIMEADMEDMTTDMGDMEIIMIMDILLIRSLVHMAMANQIINANMPKKLFMLPKPIINSIRSAITFLRYVQLK